MTLRAARILVATGAFVAGLILCTAVVLLVTGRGEGPTLPQVAAIGGPFSLTDQNGRTVTDQDFKGRPFLVFFGFTHCPDVCPTTLALLANVQKQAAAADQELSGIKVALISVDPERDTPQQLGSYIASFRGDFIGLTGNASEIVKATRAFGVASARVDLGGGNYTMDHSATVFALDSQARIVAVFTPPLSAEKLTRDLARLKPVLKPRA